MAGLAGAELVHHEALQDAVLDEHGALGGLALVVDRQGAPLAVKRAVVPGGDGGVGNLLAHLVGEDARALGDRGRLEQVAAGLVEDHAAEGVLDDDGHGARRRVIGVEHRDGGLGGRAGKALDVGGLDPLPAGHGAGALAAGLLLVALGGDRVDAHADVGALVRDPGAFGVGDEDVLELLGQGDLHLDDLGAEGPGGRVGALEHGDLVGFRHLRGVHAEAVAAVVGLGLPGLALVAALGFTGLGNLVGEGQKPLEREVAGVGVDGLGAVEHAQARAVILTGDDLFDLAVDQVNGREGFVLDVQLGEVGAAAQGAVDDLLDEPALQLQFASGGGGG
ncbi:hypothetical protein D3C72_483950 [compost metagenome]